MFEENRMMRLEGGNFDGTLSDMLAVNPQQYTPAPPRGMQSLQQLPVVVVVVAKFLEVVVETALKAAEVVVVEMEVVRERKVSLIASSRLWWWT